MTQNVLNPNNPNNKMKNISIYDTPIFNITDVLYKAEERGFEKCAICMSLNFSGISGSKVPQRPLTLLSCSHVFHAQCVQNFENFVGLNDVSKIEDSSLFVVFLYYLLFIIVYQDELFTILNLYFIFVYFDLYYGNSPLFFLLLISLLNCLL